MFLQKNKTFSKSADLQGLFDPDYIHIWCFSWTSVANYFPCDFQCFPSQLTLNMGIHKPSSAWDFSQDNRAWDLSSTSVLLPLSLYLTLSLALHPSLPVRSCPPSHLSCDVYGPFCFCVLMTTVTESYPLPMRPDERCYPDALLTPLCPWLQRRCLASQLRPLKNEDGGTWGSWTEDLSVILPTGYSYPPSPHHRRPSPLYPANGNMGLVSMAVAMMLSLILRWWIVPLPFT